MARSLAAFLLPFLSLATLNIPAISMAYVPPVFIFGDSTVDVGNNNFLQLSTARVDYSPYGFDFALATPTGRFTNGLNSADFLAILVGHERSPPAFLSLTSSIEARNGVNFASGGSGILESTGNIFGQVITMNKQLEYFATICSNFTVQMGSATAKELLYKSMFFISTGSNDFFQTYAAQGLLDKSKKNTLIVELVLVYKSHLKTLYKLGARKVGLINVPAIGCCPAARHRVASRRCLKGLNEAAHDFHVAMSQMLRDLSNELPLFKYALGNTYQMVISFLENPLVFGFNDVKTACCGGGDFNGESLCLPNSTVCSNRDEFLFWDLYHPSQAASKLSVDTLFGATRKFVSPINFAQLASS